MVRVGRREFKRKSGQKQGCGRLLWGDHGVGPETQFAPYYGGSQTSKAKNAQKRGHVDGCVPINIKGVHVHAFWPHCWFEVWPDLGSKFGLLGLDLGESRAGPQFLAADLGKKAACALPHCRVPCA